MGIALRPNLAPELYAICAPLAPTVDQVRHVGPQHLAGPLGTAWTRGQSTPEVRIHGRAAEAELLGDRGDRRALGVQRVDGFVGRDPHGMPLLLLGLPPLLLDVRALAPAPVHGGSGHRTCHQGERLRGVGGSGLERGPLVVPKGLDRFAEVFDQMKAIHDLHGMRCSPANAIGVERTPITTDDEDGRMLREPGGHALRRALGQQVKHPMIVKIDQDGPVALPPPPRSLVHADDLRSGGSGRWGPPHQPQQGGGTGPPLEAGREPGACLATEGKTEGAQVLDESQRPACPGGRHGGQTFGENLAGARGIITEKLRTRRCKRTT